MGDTTPPSANLLFEYAACGLLVTDVSGQILRANATFCGWLGYEPADLNDRCRIQDLLTVGGRVFHHTHWAPLLQMQGSVAEVKLVMRHRAGHTVPMLMNAVRRRDGDATYDELAVIVVTDRHKYEQELLLARKNAEAALAARKSAQQALQQSRDVLGLAMRGAGMGAWSHDLATGQISWGRELEELAGYSEGDFSGSSGGFFDLIHREDRAAFDLEIKRAMATGNDFVAEFRFRHADGAWHWMEGRGRASYDSHNSPLTIHGLGMDVTDRKEAQTVLLRQAAIFEHLSDAIIITNRKGIVIDFNAGGERMLGYRADEVVGRPISTFHPPADARRIRKDVIAGMTVKGTWRGELMFVRRDGSRGVCETVVKPLTNARGDVYGAVCVNHDITERRRAEQQLQRLNLELSTADRRKDEFLATLAHELRNPLAPMRNVLEVLRMKDVADPQLVWLRGVFDRQLQHLTHLVDDLLEVSRITQGKLELRKEKLELAPSMQAAMEAARPLVSASSHSMSVTFAAEPIYVDADPTRLSQMILNLLNNAAKYTPPGGKIWLSVQRQGAEAVISVRDTGIGIPTKHLASVFEMFSQLAPALERSQGGLGIGLALVRGLAELHGGTVTAYSAGLGKGSQFVIRLPVVEPPEAPVENHAAVADKIECRRVLIVDDNEDAAESLAMVLELEGHLVCTANSGLAGLARMDEFRPEVVILDIGLPDVSGYEVARRIRDEYRTRPRASDRRNRIGDRNRTSRLRKLQASPITSPNPSIRARCNGQ